jgi:hypothetical protein
MVRNSLKSWKNACDVVELTSSPQSEGAFALTKFSIIMGVLSINTPVVLKHFFS